MTSRNVQYIFRSGARRYLCSCHPDITVSNSCYNVWSVAVARRISAILGPPMFLCSCRSIESEIIPLNCPVQVRWINAHSDRSAGLSNCQTVGYPLSWSIDFRNYSLFLQLYDFLLKIFFQSIRNFTWSVLYRRHLFVDYDVILAW